MFSPDEIATWAKEMLPTESVIVIKYRRESGQNTEESRKPMPARFEYADIAINQAAQVSIEVVMGFMTFYVDGSIAWADLPGAGWGVVRADGSQWQVIRETRSIFQLSKTVLTTRIPGGKS